MSRHCTCPPDGEFYCNACAALALRGGLALPTAHVPRVTPTPQPQADGVPERVFLSRIRALASAHGWLVYHTHDSRKSEEGFPDLVLTDGASVLIVELKTNTGKTSRAQQQWLNMLSHAGTVDVALWRPRDWSNIVQRLTHTHTKETPAR